MSDRLERCQICNRFERWDFFSNAYYELEFSIRCEECFIKLLEEMRELANNYADQKNLLEEHLPALQKKANEVNERLYKLQLLYKQTLSQEAGNPLAMKWFKNS